MKIKVTTKFDQKVCPNCRSEHSFIDGDTEDVSDGFTREYYCMECNYNYQEVWVFAYNIENYAGDENEAD